MEKILEIKPKFSLGIKDWLKKSRAGTSLIAAWNKMEESATPIKGKNIEEVIESLSEYYSFNDHEKAQLIENLKKPKGEQHIRAIQDEVNRHANHRRAFGVNIPVQFLLVDITNFSISDPIFGYTGVPLGFLPGLQVSAAFASVNAVGVLGTTVALNSGILRAGLRRQLLRGPQEKPKKTIMGAIFGGNRKRHNKHQRQEASFERAKSGSERVYRTIHTINTITPLFGAQALVAIPAVIANGRYILWSFRNQNKANAKSGEIYEKMKL